MAKDTADKLATIGTPEDIPEDARRAFELAIEKIESIPTAPTARDADAIAATSPPVEKKDLDALTTYVTASCISPDAPSN